ncbi:MAG: hypothetical protein IKQ35_00410 [Bacilli bacterium]|nr:hypothetical protein [Bacilli bacterium]
MKKVLWVFALFCLLATIIVVQDAFGLFETNVTATKDLDVGRWKIYLNGEDISLAETITLDDFVYTNPQHTESGYFAPGSSAEFEIEIDASQTDVAIDYDIQVDSSSLEPYPNIDFNIIDMATNTGSTDNHFTGIMNLNDASRVKRLKLSIDWENDPDYDENDTLLVGQELVFTINVHFSQHV